MNLKNVIIFLITLAIGLAAFSLMGGETHWSVVWASLLQMRWWQGLVLFLLLFLSIALTSWSWQIILEEEGRKVNPFSLLQILIIGFSLSYLTPLSLVGGEALKAYFVHERLKVSWKKGIVSIVLQEIINFFVVVVLMIAGLAVFFSLGGRVSKKLGFLSMTLLFLFLLFFFLLLLKSNQHKSLIGGLAHSLGLGQILKTDRMKSLLAYEEETLNFFNHRRRDFWKVIGLSFLAYVVIFFQAFFLIYFLMHKWAFSGALITQAFSGISGFMLLPASLGSLEMLEGVAFQALGLSLTMALTFSLVWRGLRLAMCGVGGAIFLWLMRKSGREKLNQFWQAYSYGKSKDS